MDLLSKDDHSAPLLYVLRTDAMGDFVCSVATEIHKYQLKP